MANPFLNRIPTLSGPAHDIVPVLPDDATDMPDIAAALYVEIGGVLNVISLSGQTRSITVADRSFLPVGVRRVNATGTTADGIHALTFG